jgi:serine/threonine protein kinase
MRLGTRGFEGRKASAQDFVITDAQDIITVMPPKFLVGLGRALRAQSKNRDHAAESSNLPDAAARTSRVTLEIGAVIAQRYRLDAELGRGGMGVVYRAHDIPNHRDVAIKFLPAGEASASAREQFSREAQITARLNHPHIVAVYETGAVDTGAREPLPFIVMELIQGKSLSEMRGLTFAQIIDLGQQLCDALEYAHRQGLVHRDLKPQNVLVEKRGYRYLAKLVDLGLARPREPSNLTGGSGLAGTVYYLAPEVIAGKPADVAADLYALGVVLYEMVTGRVPFSNFDEETILAQHLNESVVPPSHSRRDVPPALEAIILRLLAKDPRARFASAQKVSLALAQVASALARDGTRGNLPPLPPGWVGQENDIARVKQLLESSRLVTLDAGDDRQSLLAQAVGAELVDQFSDGVWLVRLGAGADPALVPQQVASVLGVREEPNRAWAVSLVDDLREKNLLLILDHCHRLVGACALLAQTILHACPAVYLLVTSDQPLNVSGETCYRAET